MMSTSTVAPPAGLRAEKWRVLNALFYADRWTRVSVLLREQDVAFDDVVDLEQRKMVFACIGDQGLPIKLADLRKPDAAEVCLSPLGRRLVTTNPANQVICCLVGKSNYTARVCDCKGEGMADDDLLLRMGAAGLIEPCPVSGFATSLDGFKRLPRDLRLRLTRKGCRYFPNGM